MKGILFKQDGPYSFHYVLIFTKGDEWVFDGYKKVKEIEVSPDLPDNMVNIAFVSSRIKK